MTTQVLHSHIPQKQTHVPKDTVHELERYESLTENKMTPFSVTMDQASATSFKTGAKKGITLNFTFRESHKMESKNAPQPLQAGSHRLTSHQNSNRYWFDRR
jgi:hypothetical protein